MKVNMVFKNPSKFMTKTVTMFHTKMQMEILFDPMKKMRTI